MVQSKSRFSVKGSGLNEELIANLQRVEKLLTRRIELLRHLKRMTEVLSCISQVQPVRAQLLVIQKDICDHTAVDAIEAAKNVAHAYARKVFTKTLARESRVMAAIANRWAADYALFAKSL